MTHICPICQSAMPDNVSACPTCGFTSMEKTQSFAPITMSPTEHIASRQVLNDVSLKIVRGQQVGTEFKISGECISVGRSPQCDVFLNDMTVSRDHAAIVRTPEGYKIEDHGSYNGVWINNVNVTEGILRDGDILQIGQFCLLFSSKPVA